MTETEIKRDTMSSEELRTHVENYFRGEDLTATSFLKKYSYNSEETPEDVFARTTSEFYRKELENGGSSEGLFSRLSGYINGMVIIPQGSVLASIGIPGLYSSLSNCTVIGEIPDSYGGIGYRDQQLTHLMKRRCGVGLNLDNLRPKNTPVNNSARISTGATTFMSRFSNTTNEVAQGGRRGALMLSINMNHTDSPDFIIAKRDRTKITGANISVQLEDSFMEAARDGREYFLKFPVDLNTTDLRYLPKEELDSKFPKGELVQYPENSKSWVRRVDANALLDELMTCAWESAEPGVIYRTRHNKFCPSHIYTPLRNVTTNPCGEIMMGANDSCRLIAMNFFAFVVNPFTRAAYFCFETFRKALREAVRMSDNLVDLEIESVQRIIDKVKSDPEEIKYKQTEIETWEAFKEIGALGRRQGLGFTGLADAMAALNIGYASEKSLISIEQIMKFKFATELEAQIDLAEERGAFPLFDAKLEEENSYDEDGWFYMVKTEFPELWERMQKSGRRSCSWSTVAPCGTISMLPGVSSGIEPVFMLRYNRRKKVNPDDKDVRVDFVDEVGESFTNFAQLHPKFKMWAEINFFNVLPYKSTVNFDSLTEEEWVKLEEASPWFGSTAEEIDWIKRVELQSIVQKYTTHSISSTINLPNDVSVEKVKEIYQKAWEMKLKGVTVYRDGCRSGILTKTADTPGQNTEEDIHIPKRPDKLACKVVRFQNNYDKWIAFIGLTDSGRPYEIFTGKEEGLKLPSDITKGYIIKRRNGDQKKHYDFQFEDEGTVKTVTNLERSFNPEYWNYAKLVSGLLRHRMPLEYVIETIKGLNFEDVIHTWRNGVVRALKKYLENGKVITSVRCLDPNCGGRVIMEEGCEKCIDCGSTKCG